MLLALSTVAPWDLGVGSGRFITAPDANHGQIGFAALQIMCAFQTSFANVQL